LSRRCGPPSAGQHWQGHGTASQTWRWRSRDLRTVSARSLTIMRGMLLTSLCEAVADHVVHVEVGLHSLRFRHGGRGARAVEQGEFQEVDVPGERGKVGNSTRRALCGRRHSRKVRGGTKLLDKRHHHTRFANRIPASHHRRHAHTADHNSRATSLLDLSWVS
jgi:hypothetical protein